MPNRWWLHEGVRFELAATHRTPQLIIRWPDIPGVWENRGYAWVDEASFGLDVLAGEDAWPLIAPAAGPLLDPVRAAVQAAGCPPLEERGRLVRTWGRTVERGFLPGDHDEVDALTVTRGGATVEFDERGYQSKPRQPVQRYTLAELAAPTCPVRERFALCVPRLDAWLAALG